MSSTEPTPLASARGAPNPAMRASCSSSSSPRRSPVDIGVRMKPGDTQLTRTPRRGELARDVAGVAQDRRPSPPRRPRRRRTPTPRSTPRSRSSRLPPSRIDRDGGPRAHVHAPEVDAGGRGPTSPRWCPRCRGRRSATMPALLTSTSSRPNSSGRVATACSRDRRASRRRRRRAAPRDPARRATSSTSPAPRASSRSAMTTLRPFRGEADRGRRARTRTAAGDDRRPCRRAGRSRQPPASRTKSSRSGSCVMRQ